MELPDVKRLERSLESAHQLDEVADRIDPFAERLVEGKAGDLLLGKPLGHALHPLMTDLPLGCYMSAHLIDLLTGKSGRRASQRLIGLGLVFTVPTIASGLAEFSGVDKSTDRRLATAHAIGNVAATLFYFRSWRSRRRGHHISGAVWALGGGVLALSSGYLGGHLSFGKRVGTGERGFEGVDAPPPAPSGSDAFPGDNAGRRAAMADLHPSVGE